jgi:hypothetical protein
MFLFRRKIHWNAFLSKLILVEKTNLSIVHISPFFSITLRDFICNAHPNNSTKRKIEEGVPESLVQRIFFQFLS